MILAVRGLAILLFLVSGGGLIYLLATTAKDQWHVIPVGGGVSLVTASLAGLVALSAAESFNARRQREIESALRSRREGVYEKLLRHLTASFVKEGSESTEVEIRAAVSVWASAELIDALADWHTTTGRIMREDKGVMSPSDKVWAQEALGEIAVLARTDLSARTPASKEVSPVQIANMVFNDYDPSRSTPTQPE